MKMPSLFRLLRSGLLAPAIMGLFAIHAAEAVTLTWDGSDVITTGAQGGIGTWNTNGAYWWNGSADGVWPNPAGLSDGAIFGGTAGTVTLTGVTGNNLTFNTTGYTLASGTLTLNGSTPTISAGSGIAATISSSIAGTSGLAKVGAGLLTLSGNNTYTGATTIANGGTISIGSDANLGTAPVSATPGSLLIDASATLATTATFTLNANRGIVIGPNSGSGSGILDVAVGTILSYGGIITSNGSGTGGLTKAGLGTLVLSGSNLYTGDTSISAGTLKLGSGSAIPSGLGKGNVAVSGTLDLNGNSAGINGLSGAGTVTSSVAGSVTLTVGSNNQTSSFSGAIQNGSGTLALAKTGTGTLTLGGTNAFTGGVTINGGALQLASAGALNSSSPNSLIFGASAAVGTKLQLNGNNLTVSSLATNVTPGTVVVENANAAAVTLTINQAGNTTFAGVLQDGTGGGALSLTKSGAGILTLSGTNSYTGITTISAGTLALTNGSAILDTGAVVLANTVGATLLLNASETIGSLAGGGTSGGNVTLQGFTLTSGGANTDTTYSGVISGSGSLVKTGSGTLTLANANLYAGTTAIKNGVISLGISNALPTSTILTLGDGTTNASGVLRLNGFTQSLAGLAIAGTGTGNRIVNGSATALNLTLNVASSSSFSGSFGGSGTNENNLGLIKSGAGVLTLSGSSTYTGTTSISNGTLSVSSLVAGGNLGSAVTAVVLGDATNKGILSYSGSGDTFSRGFTLGAGGGEVDSTVSSNLLTISTGGISGTGLFAVGGAGDTSISSNITSSGGLTKSGLGTLTLSGVNSYPGVTSILNGVISLGVNNTGLNAATSLILGDSTFNTNGVLKLSGFSQTLAGLSKIGNGTLNRVVGGSASLSNFTLNIGSLTSVNVVLGGSGTNENNLSFTKFGTGALTLSAINTYTGGTIIGDATSGNNGILAIGSDANLGATGGVSIYWSTLEITSSFSFTRSITLYHSSSAISVDSSQTFNVSGAIGGTGALNLTGPGTLAVSGTSNSWSGGTNVQNGTLVVGANNALPTNTVVTLGNGTNSGILKLGGFNQTIGGLQISGSGSNKVVNGSLAASTLTIDNASSYTYAGVLGGVGTNENNFGLTKSNTGLLTLSGINTYTGTTTVNAGILALAGGAAIADTGAVSLANILGAGLQLNASETIGSLAGGGTTGGTLNLQTFTLTAGGNNSSTSFAGVISGTTTGNLVKAGTGTLTLSNSNTFTGGLTINGGVIQLANAGALNSTTPNAVTFGLSAAAGTKLQLNGNTVTIGALSTNATPGSPVIENANSLASTLTVSQTTTTAFAGVLQDGTGGGALALTKLGSGVLTLSGANTYTGLTTVSGGTLTLSGGAAIADTGAVSVSSGATLLLSSSETIGSLTGAGAVNLGTFTLTVGGDNTSPADYSGGIAATAGSLVKIGTGTYTPSGSNLYTGTTTIAAGTLVANNLASGKSLGNAASAVVLGDATNKGTLSYSGNTVSFTRGFSISAGGGEVDITTAGQTLTLSTGTIVTAGGLTIGGAGATTISSIISGSGSLTKTSTSGTLVLSGANTYLGDTIIQGGTLQLGIVTGIPSGTTKGNVSLVSGATLDVNGKSPTINGLTGGGTILNNGTTGQTISIGSNNITSTFDGVIQDGTGTLAFTKTGTGTLTLTNANTYSGTTTVATGGILKLGNAAAIPSGSGKGNVSLTGALDLNGNSITLNGLSGAGGISSSIAGAVTLTVGANDATGLSYTGVIGIGTGTVSLTKIGTGTLTFGGASTYTGATNIKNGTLALSGAANRLPSATILTLGDSSTNTCGIFSLSGTSQTVGGLATAGTGTTNRIINGSATAATLTFSSSTNSTFDGILGGGPLGTANENNLALAKSGSSTLTLSGVNTFTGLTTVSVGTLALSGGSALADTDAVSVSSGATLLLNNSETIGSLTGGGGVNLGTNTLTLGGDNTSPAAYSGAIAATAGSLVKIGTGTYTPSGSNLYTGTTTIAAGTLVANSLASGKSLGSASSAVILGDVSTKGTLSYTGSSVSFTRGFTVNAGGGEVDIATAGQTLTIATGGVATSGVFTIGGAGGTTISSAITGTGSLVKTGAGALILSNSTNGYSSGTTISQGLLLVNDTTTGGTPLGTGNISVSSGANLSLSSKENIRSQTITVNPNSGIGFANATLIQSDLMTMFTDNTGGVGVLTIDCAYTDSINLSSFKGTGGTAGTWFLGSASTGTYTFASGKSLAVGNGNTYRLGGGGGTLTIGKAATLTGSGNNLQVGFAGSNGNGIVDLSNFTQTFDGTVSIVNTTLKAGNLASGGNLGTGATAISLGDDTTLGYLMYTSSNASFTRGFTINAGGGQIDTNTSGQTLTLATGGITANGLLTIGGIGNTAITSKITGTGGLTKTSTGTLTLSGNQNDFSGAVNVNGGILNFSNLTDLGTGTAIGLSGGTLQWASGNTADVTKTTVNGTRTFTLGASGGTVNTGGNNVNFANATSGTGSFSKTGAGILTLSAVNAMGNITVSGGTLQVGIAGAIPTTSNFSMSGGSTFDINGIDTTVQSLASATATDNVINSSVGSSKTLTVNNAASTSFLGVIKDNGGTGGTLALTKTGSAFTLTLASANTYTGVTTITGGTLIAPTLANVNTTSSIGKGSVSGSAADLVLNGGTLQFKGTTAQSTDRLFSIGTTAGSSLDASGTATANTISFSNTGALGFAVDSTSSRTLTLTGTNTGANTFAPVIGDGTGGGVTSLTKSAAGTWVLTGANTYSGTTTISTGTLRIGNSNPAAIPSGAGKGNVSLAGTLDLNGNSITVNGLSGAGTVTSGITGAAGISVGGNNQTSAYSGVFNNGSGAVSLTKIGSGTLTLSGTTSNYSGGTTISGGTLSIAADNNLSTTSGALSIGAGTLQVSATIASSTRAITLTDATAAISVANTFSFTTSGAITGASMPLNLTGLGTLVVSGTSNTYSGGTNVQNGTLAIGANNALPLSTTVTLGAGVNSGIFKLNGLNQEIAGLAISGSGGANKVVGGSVTPSTLTLNLPGTASFGGVLGGVGTNENNFGFTKSGVGTLTLTGINTFTGTTTVSAGTLALSGGAAIADTSAVSLANTSGVTLLLNASETLGSLAGGGTTGGNVNLGSNTLTIGGDSTNTSFSGVISGAGALTKIGTGIQTLGGSNTYAGDTTVTSGTLQIATAAAIPSGTGKGNLGLTGTLDLNGNSITVNGLTGAGTVRSNIAGAAAITVGANDQTCSFGGTLINGTGTVALTKTGTGTLTLAGTNSYTGGTTITGGILSIGADANIGGTPGSATPNSIVINGGTLSTSTTFTLNAKRGIGVGPTSGSGTGTLDVAAGTTLTYGGIIANNGSGTGGLTKTNTSGILVLSGSNTYTGDTTVQGGTLQLGIATAIPSGTGKGNVTLASGGILDVNNFSATVNGLSGSGTVTNGLSGASTFSVGSGDATSSFGGVIQDGNGILSFTKVGSGTQTLTAVQTYTGTTTVALGTLKLGVANALPFGFGNGNLTVNGTLDLAGYAQTVNALSGSGYVTNSVVGTATLTAGSQNTTSAFGGNIQNGTGTVALAKIGTGVLTLSGTNTYSGSTNITGGTLQVGSLGGLSVNSTITVASVGTLDVNGFNASIDGLLGTGTITNNGSSVVTLTAGSAGGTSSFDGVIQDGSHALALTKSGAGTLTLNGINTYSGATTISNGTLSVANPGAGGNLGSASGAIVLGDSTHKGTLSYTSNADLNYTRGFTVNAGGGEMDITSTGKTLTLLTGGVATSGTFTLGGTGNGVINSIISGSGGFTKANTGNLVLGSANTYSGDTTISSGVLQLGNAAALPSGTGKGNLVLNATLDVNNLSITISGLSGAGVLTNSGGSPITLTAGDNNAAGNFTGVLQDGGGIMSLAKIGSGLLTLGGVNTYSGNTTISGGTLQIGNSFALASGSSKGNVSIGSSGTLDLNNCNLTLNGLTGSGTVTNSLGAAVLTAGANDQTSSFGGNLQDGIGTLGLTKTGIGTLTLSGNNTFSGASTLAGGTLSMASDTALSYRSTLTVNNAGTLDLNGHLITIDGLAGTGSIINNSATRVTLTTGASGGGGIFAGTINDGTGVIALTKIGSGTVTLSNVNGYTGATTVTGGLLAITSTGALGAIPGSATPGNIVLNGGGISATNTFEINSNRGIAVGPATGSGSGSLDAAQNQTLTYNGIIANNSVGTGGMTKTGLGTLTLGGGNTYSGDTWVRSGALQIAAANAIPSGSGKGNLSLDAGTTLDLNNTNITVNGLSGSGLVSNTKTGSVTFCAGANDQTSSFGGVIENGNGTTSFNKVGAGVLTLTGSSTYTGGTTITGGKLSINVSAEIGLETNPLTISTGAALLASDSFNTSRATIMDGAGGGAGGAIEVAAGKTLDYTSSSTITGSGSLIKTGTGTLLLEGTDTFTGGLYIQAGTLAANSQAALGAVPSPGSNLYGLHLSDGATFQIQFGSWATNRQLELVGGAGGVANVDVTGSFTHERDGLVTGAGKLDALGTGTLILTAANTYSGGTIVEHGVLQVNNGSGSATGAGDVTVQNSGTLSGLPLALGTYANITGTISGSVEIKNTGALLARSGGTLTLGGLTLDGGSLSTFQLGAVTSTPAINITANNGFTLPASGSSTISIVNTGAMAAGTYHLFDYTGTAFTDTYAYGNLALANPHDGLFNMSLTNNTGNTSIDLTVTPATQQWQKNGTNTNWSQNHWWTESPYAVPNAAGAQALFINNNYLASGDPVFDTAETVTLDINATVGSIVFNNASTAFTIRTTNGSTLTLDSGSGSGSSVQIITAPNTALANNVIGVPVNLAGNLAIGVATGTYGLDISGPISGSGKSLTKTGDGPLTLSGTVANTYSGLTEVTAGTLNLNKTAGLNALAAGGLQIDSGGTVALLASNQIDDAANVTNNGAFAIGTFSETIATLSGGGTISTGSGGVLTIAGAANSTFLGVISGGGGIAKAGSGTLALNGTSTYTGGTAINGGIVQVGADNNLGDGTGGISFNGGTLFFSGSFTSNRAITLNSGGGTLDTDGSAVTLTGLISGTGTLTKQGLGTVTLNRANDYTGSTIINNGILQIGNNTALGTGSITVNPGAELEFNGDNLTSSNPLTLAGGEICTSSGTNTYNGAITLTANSSIDADSEKLIITSAVGQNGGAFGLTKDGPGVVELKGTNTYTGATHVIEGTLSLFNGAAIADTGAVNLDNTPGVQLLLNNSETIGSLSGGGSGGGNVELGGNTLTLGDGTSTRFDGIISGSDGSLTKRGSGTLTLGGANTYSGVTTISEGVLNIQNSSALGSGAGRTTVAGDAALQIQGNIAVGSEALTLDGTGIAGTGALRNISGTNTYGGLLTLANDSRINSDAGSLTLSNPGTITGSFNLTVGGLGDTTIASNLGTDSLTKDGSGSLTLGGANSYAGDTILTVGTLRMANPLAIPSGSGKGNVSLAASTTLDLNNTGITVNGLSGTGRVTNSQTGSASLTVGANNQTCTFGGVISDGYGLTAVTKVGTGTLTLTADNSYSGTTTIAAGTLRVSGDAKLGIAADSATAGNIVLQAGATLATTESFTLDRNRGIAVGPSGAGTLDVANTKTLSYGGAIADNGGSGGFTKAGSGTLVLSGPSTYTGTTTVEAGVLTVNGSIANSGSGYVRSGATLTGTGTTGAMTIDASGTLAPGNSAIGTLSVAGNLTLNGNANFELGAAGGSHASPGVSDRVIVSGDITLGGILNLTDNADANNQGHAAVGSYKLFGYTGTASGSFSSLSSPSTYHTAVHDVADDKAIYVDMYNYAAATVTPAVDLGRIHAGGTFGTQNLTVTNTGASGSFTESLGATFATPGAGLTATGTLSGIAGQAHDSDSMSVGISDTTAGAKSGLVAVNFTSQAASGSGLSNTPLASQNVIVTGFAYTGQGVWTSGSSGSWGNNGNAYGNWSAGGGVPGLDGTQSANDTATFAGAISTPATVSLDGANPSLSGLTFDNANAYTLAQGSGGELTLKGNGGAAVITVANGSHCVAAPVTLGSDANIVVTHSSDTLTISGSLAGTGFGISKAGSGTLVLSGPSTYTGTTTVEAGVLTVNGSIANSGSGYVRSGATLTGTGTTGAMTIDASGTLAPGNSAIGTLSVAGNLTLNGNANFELGAAGGSHASPGVSDRVIVSGDITLGGILNLTDNADANNQGHAAVGSYKLFGYTGTASGSFSSLSSPSTYHTAVHDVADDKAIYVDMYNYAAATVTPAVDLGRIHAGGTFGTQNLTVTNTGASGSFTESLGATFATPGAGLTATGTLSGIAGQAHDSDSMSVGISDTTAGAKSGLVAVNFTSQAASGSGLSNTPLASQNVIVTGFAYTGQGVWTSGSSGSWGNNGNAYGNWSAGGGVPGLDGTQSANDTATFAGAISTPATVSLDGANPSLSGLTFDNANAYTLAQGSGGELTLKGNGGAAVITVANGSHCVAAPVTLGSDANVVVTHSSDTLTISGSLAGTGFGISKTGSGTLVLSGTNTYTGATHVDAGSLWINGDHSLATGTVTVASGATLCGIGTIGGATTINSGGTYAPGATHGTIGKQTFESSLTLNSGSIFEWNLDGSLFGSENSPKGTYSQVEAAGAVSVDSGAIFKIVLGGSNFTSAFWDESRSWENIFTGSGSFMINGKMFSFSGSGGASQLASNGIVAGRGQFSFNGATLNWQSGAGLSAVPEPSSLLALAGLLSSGLWLRSRRNDGSALKSSRP